MTEKKYYSEKMHVGVASKEVTEKQNVDYYISYPVRYVEGNITRCYMKKKLKEIQDVPHVVMKYLCQLLKED